MVSTRGPKSRYFEKGEKVLCYEPDPTKAKVLYDSKILGIYESKDRRGRKIVQYKVHFQGWSSSWDRKVNADFVLKDTEENRQLQRDLAERAQLQLGAYLYRKERNSNKKRLRKSIATSEESADTSVGPSPTKLRPRGLSDDNLSSSSTFEKPEELSTKDECETESCCSSVESLHDEDRVFLRISERLRQYLEYDHDMIVKYGKQHTLPSRIPIVAILENFVKQTALKMVLSTTQTENSRRRSTQQRTDKKEKEFDKIASTVSLLKEVADGLRIYFDFTVVDYLLYKEEREYALSYLSEENLKNFTYVVSPVFTTELLNAKGDANEATAAATAQTSPEGGVETQPAHLGSVTGAVLAPLSSDTTTLAPDEQPQLQPQPQPQPQRRKLRSHRSDDCDLTLENCLSSIASTSSGSSTPLHSNLSISNLNCLKSVQPISPPVRDFLQSVISWHLLPSNAAPAPSMVFGAPHFARLIVKLPEFLNASSMSDEKLKILLQHLDTCVNYLESHKEWFNEENYVRSSSFARKGVTTNDKDLKRGTTELQQHFEQQTSMVLHQNDPQKSTSRPTTTTTVAT